MKNLMVSLFVFICISATSYGQTSPQKNQLDIIRVVDKSMLEIETTFGKAIRTELFTPINQQCPCERKFFLDEKMAITFINGKADWIWIDNDIQIMNLDFVRIKAYGKEARVQLVKTKTLGNKACCPTTL